MPARVAPPPPPRPLLLVAPPPRPATPTRRIDLLHPAPLPLPPPLWPALSPPPPIARSPPLAGATSSIPELPWLPSSTGSSPPERRPGSTTTRPPTRCRNVAGQPTAQLWPQAGHLAVRCPDLRRPTSGAVFCLSSARSLVGVCYLGFPCPYSAFLRRRLPLGAPPSLVSFATKCPDLALAPPLLGSIIERRAHHWSSLDVRPLPLSPPLVALSPPA